MQGIYNYIPETNHVSTVYSFAAVLYLQFMVHISPVEFVLYFYISTVRSLCAVHNMAIPPPLNFLHSLYAVQVLSE